VLPAAISEGRSLKAQLTGMLGTKMNRRKLTRRTITLNVTCPWLLLVFRLLCGSCCEETVFVFVCVKERHFVWYPTRDHVHRCSSVFRENVQRGWNVVPTSRDGPRVDQLHHVLRPRPRRGSYNMCYDHALVEVAITWATTTPS